MTNKYILKEKLPGGEVSFADFDEISADLEVQEIVRNIILKHNNEKWYETYEHKTSTGNPVVMFALGSLNPLKIKKMAKSVKKILKKHCKDKLVEFRGAGLEVKRHDTITKYIVWARFGEH